MTDKKIFLVVDKTNLLESWLKIMKGRIDSVALDPKELELLKTDLKVIIEDTEENGVWVCLIGQLKNNKALLKRLESFSEGFGEGEAPKSSKKLEAIE